MLNKVTHWDILRVCPLFLLALLPLTASAQLLHPHRCVGPSMEVTPEIRRLRANRKLFAPQEEVQLPTSVDNSTTRYFPPVFNQVGGSCVHASSIGYMFTYEMNRLLDRDASKPENRMSYQFAWNMLNEGENDGGRMEDGLKLAKFYGIMSEADYGFSGVYSFAWATGYEKYVRAMHNRATEILYFNDSVPLIKRYLYDAGCDEHPGGIVTFGVTTENWLIKSDYQGPSETGYHALLTKLGDNALTGHALTIVGYDDLVTYTDDNETPHTGAFIVCNSWGEDTHDRGRFYLPYDFFRDESRNELQLSNDLFAVRASVYQPRLVMRFSLTYSKRDELRFGISTTKNPNHTLPIYAPKYDYIMYHKGGPFPMQGQYKLKDMDVAFDASPRAPDGPDSLAKFFAHIYRQTKVNRKSGEGEVTGVELIELVTDESNPSDMSVTPLRSWTYRGTLPATIVTGTNAFAIPLRPRYRVSLSPMAWNVTSEYGNRATYRLRTANGRQAKFQVIPDADGKHAHIHYAVKKE